LPSSRAIRPGKVVGQRRRKGELACVTTPVGLVLLNDERPHLHALNEAENMAVLHRWSEALTRLVRNVDGSTPEIVVGRETIKSVRTAHEVGEQLRLSSASTSGTSPTSSGRS
jgi:hypothetical protein